MHFLKKPQSPSRPHGDNLSKCTYISGQACFFTPLAPAIWHTFSKDVGGLYS